MIIDCISDLHGFYPKLDGGDLLIVAGDLTARDTFIEYVQWYQWVEKQDYKKVIWISGNHDNCIQNKEFEHTDEYAIDEKDNRYITIEHLCDSGTEFEGLKIWGSPWSLTFPGMNPHCKAFTVDTEDELMEKFDKIPHDTDILITHTPPSTILDLVDGYKHCGSKYLYNWLKYVERPKLHVFGHIHEGYGQKEVFATYNDKMMISVNASHVNERYQPVNKPIRIIL